MFFAWGEIDCQCLAHAPLVCNVWTLGQVALPLLLSCRIGNAVVLTFRSEVTPREPAAGNMLGVVLDRFAHSFSCAGP